MSKPFYQIRVWWVCIDGVSSLLSVLELVICIVLFVGKRLLEWSVAVFRMEVQIANMGYHSRYPIHIQGLDSSASRLVQGRCLNPSTRVGFNIHKERSRVSIRIGKMGPSKPFYQRVLHTQGTPSKQYWNWETNCQRATIKEEPLKKNL